MPLQHLLLSLLVFGLAAVSGCSSDGSTLNGACVCDAGFVGSTCTVATTGSQCEGVNNKYCTRWALEGTTHILVQLDFEASGGWIGLIWGGSGGMSGDAWLFSASAGGVVTSRDGSSTGTSGVSADSTSHFLEVAGVQAGTRMRVNFKRLLNTGDADDKVMAVGTSYKAAWAHRSTSTSFTQRHTDRGRYPSQITWYVDPLPSAPLSFVVSSKTDTTIAVAWSAPSSAGASSVTGYTLEISSDAGSSYSQASSGAGTSFTVTALSASSTYSLRVKATNAQGDGPYSTLSSTTNAVGATNPGAPIAVTSSGQGGASITVSWVEPALNGGSLSYYTLEYRLTAGGGSWTTGYGGSNGDTATTATVASLTASTSYDFRVQATTSVGSGSFSPTAAFSTTIASVCSGPSCSGNGACVQSACRCNWGYVGEGCELEAADTTCYAGGKVCLAFKVDEASSKLHAMVKATHRGWIGLLFGPTGMAGADAWVMTVQAQTSAPYTDSTVFDVDLDDRYSSGYSQPSKVGDTQDLTLVAGWHTTTKTYVAFSRDLQTGDVKDEDISDGMNSFYALGPSNSQSSPHSSVNSAKLGTINFISGTVFVADSGVSMSIVPYVPLFAFLGLLIFTSLFLRLTGLNAGACRCCGASPSPGSYSMVVGHAVALLGALTALVVVFFLAKRDFESVDGAGKANGVPYALGTVCVALFSLVLLPVARNSVWVKVFGVSWERAVKFHTWFATLLIMMVIGHAVAMWQTFDTLELHTLPTRRGNGTLYGLLALACMTPMILFASWDGLRRKHFELFFFSHLAYFLAIPFAMAHSTDFLFLGLASVALYAVDRGIRMVRGCQDVQTTQAETMGSAEVRGGRVTVLRLRKPGFKCEAGSYVFVNIPAISKLEWHPFSVSSFPFTGRDRHEEFTLHILDMGPGTFTHKLAERVRSLNTHKVGSARRLKVKIDGPHGSLSLPQPLTRYKAAIMFAGGVGITPMMSVLCSLIANRGKLHLVKLVWTSRVAPGTLMNKWFSDTFDKLKSLDLAKQGISIEIFHTGTKSGEMTELRVDSSSAKKPPSVKIFSGRPTTDAQLDTVVTRYGIPSGDLAVLACGPAPMVEEVQKHAVKMGCAFHKETFMI